MKEILVHYTVKPEELETVKQAIAEFVEGVKTEEGTVYSAYQNGEYSFVHIMQFESSEAEEKHKQAAHTKKFVEVLYPRCVEKPVFSDLSQIKSTEKEKN